MPDSDPGSPLCRAIGFGICAIVFGIPAFLLLAAFTWGAILIPVLGLAILAPFFLVHYLLWGRRGR